MKVELKTCKYGQMAILPTDKYVGGSLLAYGEYYESEVELFRQIIRFNANVLEIGAHFGSLAVPLAQMCKQLIAIEPQPGLHDLLSANLALSRQNLKAQSFNMAFGDENKPILIPNYDYTIENNFGAIELADSSVGKRVEMVTLDRFVGCTGFKPDFIKLDVEGYEEKVLRGGANFIRSHSPVLYVENDRAAKAVSLFDCIDELGYKAYWHVSPIFNPNNFLKNKENIFGDISSHNMICFPKQVDVKSPLELVTRETAVPACFREQA